MNYPTPLFTIVTATHSRATILDQKVLPAIEQLTYPPLLSSNSR